jgi:hypothetical protein
MKPDEKILHSLLPNMKLATAKQKHVFQMGAQNLLNEMLDGTGSDQQSTGLSVWEPFM